MTRAGDRGAKARSTVASDSGGDPPIWMRDAPQSIPEVAAGEARARVSLVDGAEHAVRKWLAPGRFREGDRLPTEERLAEMLGISRGTLRSALRRLEDSGEVIRRQGSGTFVGRLRRLTRPGDVPWLRADSYRARVCAGAVTLAAMSIEMAAVGAAAAGAFGVDDEQPGVRIRRVMNAGEVPVAVSLDILHPDLRLPDVAVMREHLSGGATVHAMLVATMGITFSFQRVLIAAELVEPTDPVGRMLALGTTAACATLEEVSTIEGEPIHWARDVLAPGQVEIEVLQSAADTQPDRIVEREL